MSQNNSETLKELRNFRKQTRALGNDHIGMYGEPQPRKEEDEPRRKSRSFGGGRQHFRGNHYQENPESVMEGRGPRGW